MLQITLMALTQNDARYYSALITCPTKTRACVENWPFQAVRRRPGRHSGLIRELIVANETYCGRWPAPCCPGHLAICRCCNLCPKNKEPRELKARPRKFASHFPVAGLKLRGLLPTWFLLPRRLRRTRRRLPLRGRRLSRGFWFAGGHEDHFV
jgi:hypothetical protein